MEESSFNWVECDRAYLLSNIYTDFPITSLSYDYNYPLLWSGDSAGKVSSYVVNCNSPVQKYTSFMSSMTPIRSILSDRRGIWILANDNLQLRQISGLLSLEHKSTTSNFIHFDINKINQNESIIFTDSGEATIINMDRGTIQNKFDFKSIITSSSFEKELVLGTHTGIISVRDPRLRYKDVLWATCYDGNITNLKAIDSYILSNGYFLSEDGEFEDWSINFYDIRKLTEPISTYETGDPAIICNPNQTTERTALLYPDGYTEDLSIASGEFVTEEMFQMSIEEGAFVTSAATLYNYESIASCDSNGMLHLWNAELCRYSGFSAFKPCLPGPDIVEAQSQYSVDDKQYRLSLTLPPKYFPENIDHVLEDKSFNSKLENELFSTNYGTRATYDVGKPTSNLEADDIRKMQIRANIGYVENTSNKKLNQIVFDSNWRIVSELDSEKKGLNMLISTKKIRDKNKSKKSFKTLSKHLSPRDSANNGGSSLSDGHGDKYYSISKDGSRSLSPESKRDYTQMISKSSDSGLIPEHMKLVKIHYGRFGIEDFDFGIFNKTKFSGLESNIANSYMNSLLQVLYFTYFINYISQTHSKSLCKSNSCILCHLGFLFSILEDSSGKNCQATNFLRLVGRLSKAKALGVLEADSRLAVVEFTRKIQSAHRFILEQINSESTSIYNKVKVDGHNQKLIESIFGIPLITVMECTCGLVESRESSPFSIDLSAGNISSSVGSLLSGGQTSLNIQSKKTTFTQLLWSSIDINENYGACPKCNKSWWKELFEDSEQWVPKEFYFTKSSSNKFGISLTQSSNSDSTDTDQTEHLSNETPHLIAHILDSKTKKWYCFNDFVVKQVDEEEVFKFSEYR
ncbi:hypothetical protein BB560_004725, partial [Smittium megazygosporum]